MVHKMQNNAVQPALSRRNFLRRVWWVLGGIALAELAWVGLAFVRPRRARTSKEGFGGIITAGPVDKFAPNSVTAFREGRFYLARLEDGGFLALSRKCTHLGCTVPWDAQKGEFACPCHSSAFDIRGAVTNPPAPRPLDLFAVRIENGILKVDTGKPIARHQFDPSQVIRL